MKLSCQPMDSGVDACWLLPLRVTEGNARGTGGGREGVEAYSA
jgi:hypothetical protein